MHADRDDDSGAGSCELGLVIFAGDFVFVERGGEKDLRT